MLTIRIFDITKKCELRPVRTSAFKNRKVNNPEHKKVPTLAAGLLGEGVPSYDITLPKRNCLLLLLIL